eukprot:423179_1
MSSFLIYDEIEVFGLTSKPQYNGCTGKIIGPINDKQRYPISIIFEKNHSKKKLSVKPTNIKRIGNENHVYSDSDAKVKYGSFHGTQYEKDKSKLHFAGSLIDKQKLLDILFNSSNKCAQQFESLSVEDKRDVLLNKKQIYTSDDDKLLEYVEKWTGSNGAKCDGCGLTETQWIKQRKQWDNEYDTEEAQNEYLARICPDCCYSVCEDCQVHCSYSGLPNAIHRGSCYCKDSNFGYDYDPDINQRKHYQVGFVTKEQREKADNIILERYNAKKTTNT